MRLIVGCPVADRAWSLPTWYRHLAAQTRRPDGFVFIHSGERYDATWDAVWREAAVHGFPKPILHHDSRTPHRRHDNDRFGTLAVLRNEMIRVARDYAHADLLLSLDTDVMLEDPRTIERLVEMLDECDLAAPLTYLHPGASKPDADLSQPCWAYNAAWWRPEGRLDDPERPWIRPEISHVPWGETVKIDVPMAVWLAGRRVMDCRYTWHLGGEDLGFAQDLDRHDLTCLWDTSLSCRHVWQEADL